MLTLDALRNYAPAEAAEILGCTERHLLDNLRKYPHQKIGASVAFDLGDLAEIKEMCRVRPAAAVIAVPKEPPAGLKNIKPLAPRARRASRA